jgi:hypothetical protein
MAFNDNVVACNSMPDIRIPREERVRHTGYVSGIGNVQQNTERVEQSSSGRVAGKSGASDFSAELDFLTDILDHSSIFGATSFGENILFEILKSV